MNLKLFSTAIISVFGVHMMWWGKRHESKASVFYGLMLICIALVLNL